MCMSIDYNLVTWSQFWIGRGMILSLSATISFSMEEEVMDIEQMAASHSL